MSFIATKKFRIAALAVGLLFVGAVAAAGLFTGTVNSPVTVTSQPHRPS
jgi:type 1 fimbria pilin